MTAEQTQESTSSCDDWTLAGPKDPIPGNLVIQQRRYIFVFPYFRLIWSEGDAERIKMIFVSHEVVIVGHGLTELLSGLAAQRVLRIAEPLSSEAKFRRGPIVTDILVMKSDEEKSE